MARGKKTSETSYWINSKFGHRLRFDPTVPPGMSFFLNAGIFHLNHNFHILDKNSVASDNYLQGNSYSTVYIPWAIQLFCIWCVLLERCGKIIFFLKIISITEPKYAGNLCNFKNYVHMLDLRSDWTVLLSTCFICIAILFSNHFLTALFAITENLTVNL